MDFDPSAAPSREELVALCRQDPEAAADRMLMLWAMVAELAAVVATQGEEIARLKAKLAKDSHNIFPWVLVVGVVVVVGNTKGADVPGAGRSRSPPLRKHSWRKS